MTVLYIILAVLAGGVILLYNRLVRDRNRVDEAWSGIDVQLKRRHDLVPSLVEIVKGYARHESSVLEEVTRLRGGAPPSEELAAKEGHLSESIGRLMLLSEDYPQLKADQNFQQLNSQLVEIEDILQRARRYYNGAVRNLNIRVEAFPSSLVARSFGFQQRPFFEIETAIERVGPRITLETS